MKAKYSWGELSKYRNELFGLAIIQILIFHYFENFFIVKLKAVQSRHLESYMITL